MYYMHILNHLIWNPQSWEFTTLSLGKIGEICITPKYPPYNPKHFATTPTLDQILTTVPCLLRAVYKTVQAIFLCSWFLLLSIIFIRLIHVLVYSKRGMVCISVCDCHLRISCALLLRKQIWFAVPACQGCAPMALSFSSVRAFLLDIAVSAVA